jgi:hypothetical protein
MHPTAPSAPLTDLRAFTDGVTHMLGVALSLVEVGRSVDLAGLEEQIGLLCAKALDLPPDEGRAIRIELIALLARVEALSVALRHASGMPISGKPAGNRPAIGTTANDTPD